MTIMAAAEERARSDKKKHLVKQQIAKGDSDNDLQQGEAEEEPSMMWTEDK
jgi:hypothetical protein